MRWRATLATALVLLLAQAAPALPQQRRLQDVRPSIYEPLPEEKRLPELALDAGEQARMHFSLIPHGPSNILFVWGKVEFGGTDNFRAALDEAKVHEVWLFSPGGSMEDGMEIGRLLRARKVTTRIPNGARCISACNFIFLGGLVRYVGTAATFEVHMFEAEAIADRLRAHVQHPPTTIQDFIHTYPNWIKGRDEDFGDFRALCTRKPATKEQVDAFHEFCAPGSEQPLEGPQLLPEFVAFLARGWQADQIKRGAPELAGDLLVTAFLAHEAVDEDVKDIQQNSAKIAAEVARFLTEMSISLRFLTEFANIPNDVPRPLSREELRSLNVVNVD